MKARRVFEEALAATGTLRHHTGLQAIKRAEGKQRITAEDARALLGSVAIDDDCRTSYPNAARWDYVIEYERDGSPVVHFVEVHSADSSGVSEVANKLQWLLDFLERAPQAKLRALKREIHWVASGRVAIPKGTPQYRKLTTTLRAKGLNGPSSQLVLG